MRKRVCQSDQNGLKTTLFFSVAVASGVFNLPTAHAAGKPEPGLAVAFSALAGDTVKATDVTVLPNVWLYVPDGRAPTPFLPAGKFFAEWVKDPAGLERVMHEVMQMTKLDLATLQKAFEV